MEVELNQEKLDLLEGIRSSGSNFFITGNAGTGKSLLLKDLIAEFPEDKTAVVAPTGIAALNVSGQTIHSFFKFSIEVTPENVNSQSVRSETREVIKALEFLVIDEISMVRADLLDCIEIRCQKIRGNRKPFGGIQTVFFGDLYQLPPVVKRDESVALFDEYETPFLFSSNAYKNGDFQKAELAENFRQKDDDSFLEILNKIRRGEFGEEELEKINAQVKEDLPEDVITFVPFVKLSEQINNKRLAAIDALPVEYTGHTSGPFREKDSSVPRALKLKPGARVMLAANTGFGLVNGMTGEVLETEPEYVKVLFDNGREEEIGRHTWNKHNYEATEAGIRKNKIASFTQIPLKLAWATTIHKSQGLTFDKINIDWGRGTFAHGQAYVALSRCKSLEGVSLKREMRGSDVIVDERVIDFVGS